MNSYGGVTDRHVPANASGDCGVRVASVARDEQASDASRAIMMDIRRIIVRS